MIFRVITSFWPVFPVDRSNSDFSSTKRKHEMSLTLLVRCNAQLIMTLTADFSLYTPHLAEVGTCQGAY